MNVIKSNSPYPSSFECQLLFISHLIIRQNNAIYEWVSISGKHPLCKDQNDFQVIVGKYKELIATWRWCAGTWITKLGQFQNPFNYILGGMTLKS
jgi:hypothetical protein